jgi:hypothetical protein
MTHIALILHLVLSAAPSEAVASPSPDKERFHAEVARLIDELNSDRFEVRRKATDQFEKMVAKAELKRGLAAEFQRVLVRPDVSFEVRRQLERWSRQLPRPPAEPAPEVLPAELDKLLLQLDDDSYGVRLGAMRRLQWLLGNTKLICPIMLRLKQRLSDASLDIEGKRRVETLWQLARGAWLASDIASAELPKVSDERMDQWLDDLVRPGTSPANRAARDAASCELLDLLARDDYLPRLTKELRARLDKKPSAEAKASLQALLDWTKPELVAEYWQGRHPTSEQHLLVGVPTTATGGARPTCFDKVDERTAHCSSGNSLSPGNYPVGKAFPHPRQPGAFFHIVSLPTPRRRMAYVSCINADEFKRLAELSRRTLDGLLAEKRPLTEPQLVMLAQLDPGEVSRFACKYLATVDDAKLSQSGTRHIGGRPSRFGMVCARLAAEGTKDAMPGLTDAIAKNRILPPTLLAPYRLDLLAAISIAARDPWAGADAWLAERLGDTKSLMEGRPSGPEIGATAAAVLLSRHEQKPANFGLQPSPDSLLRELHVEGYRFDNNESRKKLQEWWKQKASGKTP